MKKVGAFFGWRGSASLATAAAQGAGGTQPGQGGGFGATVLIPCPECKRMNRVANDKMNAGPKCGGCGTVLVR